ncbi:MAG: dihydrofolate reductase family protein [Paracoccaceae bacterium]
MQPIIYDVAVSADGFIAGAGSDVSSFPHAGRIVDDYRERLSGYGTVLMGRSTYEFGYRFGLPPGANPYPQARSVVVSSTLNLPAGAEVAVQRTIDAGWIDALRKSADTPVYLCGGGVLASAIADLGQIQILRLKRAPIILGEGTPLFGPLKRRLILKLEAQNDYGAGLIFQEFRVEA